MGHAEIVMSVLVGECHYADEDVQPTGAKIAAKCIKVVRLTTTYIRKNNYLPVPFAYSCRTEYIKLSSFFKFKDYFFLVAFTCRHFGYVEVSFVERCFPDMKYHCSICSQLTQKEFLYPCSLNVYVQPRAERNFLCINVPLHRPIFSLSTGPHIYNILLPSLLLSPLVFLLHFLIFPRVCYDVSLQPLSHHFHV